MPDALAEVDARRAYADLLLGALLLVDVRDLDEWTAIRVRGAAHIPLSALPKRVEELCADPRRVALICESGQCSAGARELVQHAGGRSDCCSVRGGIRAWAKACLPLCGTHFDKEGSP
ncbi:MAG: hypothetical protein NVSMB25_12240 [Thermoleophilaceae bacterium]